MMDRIAAAKSERRLLDEECQDHIKERTKLELDIKDLERTVREDSTLKVNYPKCYSQHLLISHTCTILASNNLETEGRPNWICSLSLLELTFCQFLMAVVKPATDQIKALGI